MILTNLNCRNCEHPLKPYDRFCPHCGQKVQLGGLYLKEIWREVSDEVFSLDNRLIRTAKAILSQPGEITLAYLTGKRIQYYSPIRLHLFLSILLVFSLETNEKPKQIFSHYVSTLVDNGAKYRSIDLIISNLEIDSIAFDSLNSENSVAIIESSIKNQGFYPFIFLRNYVLNLHRLENRVGWEKLASYEDNIYSYSIILCMPILAIFLMVFFRTRFRFFVPHLIHSIHLTSVGIILLIVGNILRDKVFTWFIPDSSFESPSMLLILVFLFIFIFFALIPLLIYGFLDLKTVYGESRLATIFKLFAVSILYGFSFQFIQQIFRFSSVFYVT